MSDKIVGFQRYAYLAGYIDCEFGASMVTESRVVLKSEITVHHV